MLPGFHVASAAPLPRSERLGSPLGPWNRQPEGEGGRPAPGLPGAILGHSEGHLRQAVDFPRRWVLPQSPLQAVCAPSNGPRRVPRGPSPLWAVPGKRGLSGACR